MIRGTMNEVPPFNANHLMTWSAEFTLPLNNGVVLIVRNYQPGDDVEMLVNPKAGVIEPPLWIFACPPFLGWTALLARDAAAAQLEAVTNLERLLTPVALVLADVKQDMEAAATTWIAVRTDDLAIDPVAHAVHAEAVAVPPPPVRLKKQKSAKASNKTPKAKTKTKK